MSAAVFLTGRCMGIVKSRVFIFTYRSKGVNSLGRNSKVLGYLLALAAGSEKTGPKLTGKQAEATATKQVKVLKGFIPGKAIVNPIFCENTVM